MHLLSGGDGSGRVNYSKQLQIEGGRCTDEKIADDKNEYLTLQLQLTDAGRWSASSVCIKALPHPFPLSLLLPHTLHSPPPHVLSLPSSPPAAPQRLAQWGPLAICRQRSIHPGAQSAQPASKPARPVLSCPACEAGWRPLCSPPFYQPASPRIT